MLVKNILGTGTRKCKCGNWMSHWMKYSKQSTISTCAKLGCTDKAEDGGHVIKCSPSPDKNWYIIPLCKKHNSSSFTECYSIKSSIILVSANISLTCG